jgi:hypothetical protein
MGYTHYWNVQRDADRDKLVEAGREMAKVVEAAGDLVAGWNGVGSPTLDPTTGEVRFNGRDNGVDDLSHETFVWPPDLEDSFLQDKPYVFTFCKTAQKPYDVAVVACLLVAERVMGDAIEVSSDAQDFVEFAGGEQSEGWRHVNAMLGHPTDVEHSENAVQLYERVFNEAPPIPASFILDEETAKEEA